MNFDADRLSKLSGLGTIEDTGILAESVELQDEAVPEEGDNIDECCGCAGNPDKHDSSYGPMITMSKPTPEMVGHGHSHNDYLFETEDGDDEEQDAGEGVIAEEDDSSLVKPAMKDLQNSWARQIQPNKTDATYDNSTAQFKAMIDAAINNGHLPDDFTVDESAPLTMETLRNTVLELRDEIIAEQAAEQQALTEAPVRSAIRKEIKALLAEMPKDAATNWMYGDKGRPSASDTAASDKSRATALFGLGFETK